MSIDTSAALGRRAWRVRRPAPIALRAMTRDLVSLLERRAVDPFDQRLADHPDRAELDRVRAHLIAGGAHAVRRIHLLGGLGDRLAERGLERRAALGQRSAPAVLAVQRPGDLVAQDQAQVLLDDAVEPDVERRPEMGPEDAVPGLVVDREVVLDLVQQIRAQRGAELGAHEQRPPGVHDPHRVGLVVVARGARILRLIRCAPLATHACNSSTAVASVGSLGWPMICSA